MFGVRSRIISGILFLVRMSAKGLKCCGMNKRTSYIICFTINVTSILITLLLCTGYWNKQKSKNYLLLQDTFNRERHNLLNYSHVTANKSDHVTKVLLVTCFRGGSTFLGEAFNSNPDVFYWFEPLIGRNWNNASIVEEIYIKTSHEYLRYASDPLVAQSNQILKDIFHCELTNLDSSVLEHYFLTNWTLSQKLEPYKDCMISQRVNNTFHRNATRMCLPLAIRACQLSSVRVIKTIRYGLYMAEDLVKSVPDLHIVYFVRDPRGIITSRLQFYMQKPLFYSPVIETEANVVCQRLHDDMKWLRQIILWTNSTTRMHRYEDLAAEPIREIKDIYTELSLKLPEEVVKYLNKVTKAEMDVPGHLSLTRRDSKETAYRWRSILPARSLGLINKHPKCIEVFKELNYSIDAH